MFQPSIDNNNSRNKIKMIPRNNEVRNLENMINNLKSYIHDSYEEENNYRGNNNYNNRRHLTKNMSYCKILDNDNDEFYQMQNNNNDFGDKIKEDKKYKVKSCRPKSHYVELKFSK